MLPKAVREQAERAEALHAQLIANTASPATVDQPAPTPPVEAVIEAAPVVAEAPAPAAPAPLPATDPWELKYRVLNGKYTAEVPRQAATIRELTEALRVAKEAPLASAAASDVDVDTVTPDAVRDQYGDDFANAVTAIADARADKLRKELGSDVEAIKAQNAETRHATFLRDIGTAVPNWQAIDADPGFTAYLDEFDAQTGRVRREFFNEADAGKDAARVASFFASYSRGKQPLPAAIPTPVVAPNVDHLISPTSSRQSEAPVGKKLWTKAEVNRFYADARPSREHPTGRFTAAEYARIDADISVSSGEGRYLG